MSMSQNKDHSIFRIKNYSVAFYVGSLQLISVYFVVVLSWNHIGDILQGIFVNLLPR